MCRQRGTALVVVEVGVAVRLQLGHAQVAVERPRRSGQGLALAGVERETRESPSAWTRCRLVQCVKRTTVECKRCQNFVHGVAVGFKYEVLTHQVKLGSEVTRVHARAQATRRPD